MESDYLHCNPSFNKQPRYDCVIVKTNSGNIFAQLVLVFTVSIRGTAYAMALVQAFDQQHNKSKPTVEKDTKLQFLRLIQRKPIYSEFIFMQSIIRGAIVYPAFDIDKDSIMFDLPDGDMMFRVQDILNDTRIGLE